jgi:hypothetical protein
MKIDSYAKNDELINYLWLVFITDRDYCHRLLLVQLWLMFGLVLIVRVVDRVSTTFVGECWRMLM